MTHKHVQWFKAWGVANKLPLCKKVAPYGALGSATYYDTQVDDYCKKLVPQTGTKQRH